MHVKWLPFRMAASRFYQYLIQQNRQQHAEYGSD